VTDYTLAASNNALSHAIEVANIPAFKLKTVLGQMRRRLSLANPDTVIALLVETTTLRTALVNVLEHSRARQEIKDRKLAAATANKAVVEQHRRKPKREAHHAST
jgi:hypothetical protein